jgi:nucleotide-binding universal stress UspA family protein
MTSRPAIIVGIDGSSRGDDALAFARAHAEAVGPGLLLVHAYGPDGHRDEAREILEARRAGAGGVPVEVVAYADPSPARALHRVAAARRAAFIVIGPSHRAGIGLVFPGSTAQQLLPETPRAVVVVPRGWRPAEGAPLQRVGCGYDGSPEARAALHSAVELTRALGGRLDVVRAFWSPPLAGPNGIAVAADLEARVHAGLGEAVQELPEDVHARARLLLDDPARALVAHSRELDVLLLGSRGKGPVGAIWAGSVSSAVIRKAACLVIVVPRGVLLALPEHGRPTATQST